MAFIPVPDVAQVELRYTLFGQLIENTLYFKHASAITLPDLVDLAAAMEVWAVGTLAALSALSVDLKWREAYATDLTTVTSPTAVSAVDAGETGAGGGPALPGNVCACISFRTATRGRAGRGRNYISGITEAVVTGNTLDSGAAGGFVTRYELLITAPPTGWTWVIVSRQLDGVPRLEGLPLTVTSCGLTDLYIDSQRRRLTGRGA